MAWVHVWGVMGGEPSHLPVQGEDARNHSAQRGFDALTGLIRCDR